MLKALIKKNWAESRAKKMPHFILIVFVLSLADLSFGLPAVVWAIIGIFLIIMGPVNALGGFIGDVNKDYYKFLEYLPLRRSAIWFSNFLDGLMSLFLMILPLVWQRVVFYKPVDIEPFVYCIPTRWAIFVGGLAGIFWMFSVAVFFSAYFDLRPLGASTAVIFPLVLLLLFMTCLAKALILPSATEIAPIFFLSGLFFSAGSFFLFAVVPKHMRRERQFCLIALPLFLLITALGTGHLYLNLRKWKELEPWEKVRIFSVHPLKIKGEPERLLLNIHSERSRDHFITLNVESGISHHLGRGLVRMGESALPWQNKRLYFQTSFDAQGLFQEIYSALVSVKSDGSDLRRLFTAGDYRRSGEQESVSRSLYTIQVSGDDSFFVLSEYVYRKKDNSSITNLVVSDEYGRVMRKIEARNYADFYLSPTNNLLCLMPLKETRDKEKVVDESPYRIIDLKTSATKRFDLPGSVIWFSPNLDRVACLETRIAQGRRYQSITLVSLPPLNRRIILSEQDMPVQEIQTQVREKITPECKVLKTDFTAEKSFSESVLYFNKAFDRAVWLKKRVDGDDFRFSLILINLDNGERKEIVGEADLPRQPLVTADSRTERPVVIHGFDSSGRGVIYNAQDKIFLVEAGMERPMLLADDSTRENPKTILEKTEVRYEIVFSPSRHRVMRYRTWSEYWGPLKGTRSITSRLEVFEDGNPRTIYTSEGTISAFWLDEERIIVKEAYGLFLLNADGSGLRRIFGKESSVEDL